MMPRALKVLVCIWSGHRWREYAWQHDRPAGGASARCLRCGEEW